MSNTLHNNDIDDYLYYILLFRLIIWGYIGIIFSLLGIVGNILTILALASPSMRTTLTNIYLIALSCSNILYLLIFIPSYSIRYLLGYSVYMSNGPPFLFEILLLRFPTTPIYNTIYLSIIYLTIAVSVDRLIFIKFPSKAKQILTKRTTLITILIIYIFAIVYCIPFWLEQRYVPETKQCVLTEIGRRFYKYTRIYIYIPVVCIIPLVTLVCITIIIIQDLVAKKRHNPTLGENSADYNITLMLVIMIIILLLSQSPSLILNTWYAIDPHSSYSNLKFHALNSIGILFIVLNTSTIFLLYCLFSQQFRKILTQFIFNLFPNRSNNTNTQAQTSEQNQIPAAIPQQQQMIKIELNEQD